MLRPILAFALVAAMPLAAVAQTKVLWDRYGVPHIFAPNIESMFHAHGWSQMRNHADLLLKLYGQSRGRGAEYWGADGAPLDRWVHLNGVPERAKQWYEQQSPEFRKNLDAFAKGINDFAKKYPNHVSAQYRQVLPVTGVDVVGHTLRAVHYMYMGSQDRVKREAAPLLPKRAAADFAPLAPTIADAGSNTWTVGPSRSASGKAMLVINPHLLWDDFYSYMEVHLTAPGYDLYGAPQIGFPVPVIGFNRNTGWGRTVNTIDTVDIYRLTVKNGQYEFDGALKKFETAEKAFKIKQADGSFTTEKVAIRRSVHGPIVFDEQGVTLAMRVAGIDRPKMLEQWFRMGGAKNLAEFQQALRMESIPMWNANYADDQGHIMLVFNGLVAKRRTGDAAFWGKVVPGNTSETMWTDYHSFDDLPKSIDPKIGFNQNANEPPWLTTVPQLDPRKYPAYMAPGNERMPTYRTKRSLRILTEDPSITYEELMAYKHSTRMEAADSVLPDLLKVATASTDAAVKEAAGVLTKWDRNTDTTSRGAVLFQIFCDLHFGAGETWESKLRVKYDPAKPLESGYGIADTAAAMTNLAKAAAVAKQVYGRLDVPWGDVFRFERGTRDVPGNGGHGRMGVFRTMNFGKKKGDKFYGTHGETFVCAIEFGSPQRANCVLGYGNATQPGSKHIEDQLPLMVDKRMHPVWRERKDIQANLELSEDLPALR